MAAPRWLSPVLLTTAAILMLAAFTGEIRDTDVWLHLKTGEHTWQSRALTVPDPFSYTTYTTGTGAVHYAGEDVTRYFNLTHEWLAQIIMYAIYRAAGFPGLVLARAALLMIFCGLVGWIAAGRTNNFLMGLAAALAAADVAFHFQQSRPFLATFVFLALTMAILESVAKRESGRAVWLLPPVFLIWGNCHAGFFMGWLVLGAYACEATIRRLQAKPVADADGSPAKRVTFAATARKQERRLWLAAAASFLASGLNPNGFRVIQILFLYQSSGIQTNNLEWQHPKFWEPGVYSFLLFGSFLALVLARRGVRPRDWLLYLGFAAASLIAVRNVILIGLIGPIVMAAYLPGFRTPKPRALPAAALLLAAATLLTWDVAPAVASGNVLALRAAQWQLPVGAADFIQAHRITSRMFNNYESGGYLVWRLWPMQRDFIDPRGLSEEAYADYRHILFDSDAASREGREKLFRKYEIQMVVTEGFDYLSGQVYPLVVGLADSQDAWKPVYSDSNSLIFMRHPPPGVAPLSSPEALLESLEAQCEQHMVHDPGRPGCARGLSELHAFQGRPDRALRWITYYLEHRTGPDPEAEKMYQSLRVTSLSNQALSLENQGDLAGAEPLFRSALQLAGKALGPEHPDTAGALNNLAGLLESKGDYAGAEAFYRQALAIAEKTLGPADPRTAMSLDNLAGVLQAKGDLGGAEPLYRRALSIAEKTLGPDHATTQAIREDLEGLTHETAK